MPFPTTLDSDQLTKLRSRSGYFTEQYISLCPNNTIVQATIAPSLFSGSYASFTLDTIVDGDLSDVIVGMRVLLGPDKRTAYPLGRIRKAGSGMVIYVNEVAKIPVSGDYIWIIDDYPELDKLGRISSANIYYKDYDLVFRHLLPVVDGLQSAYAGWVDEDSGVISFTFDASTSYAAANGATISSYLYTLPSTATVTGGSVSTSTVTVDFEESAGDWCHLLITDSGGRTTLFHFIVFPHSENFPPALDFTGAQITGNIENGWSASIEAFAGVSDVLDRTLVCIWNTEWYAEEEGPLLGEGYNVKFVGRLRSEANTSTQDEKYSSVRSTRYQIDGCANTLERTQSPSIALRYKSTATAWDEISIMALWREVVYTLSEHSTALSQHSLAFDSRAVTYLDKLYTVNKGGLSGAVDSISKGINAKLCYAPQGELYVARAAVFLTDDERDALPTVIDYTTSDMMDWTLEIEHGDPNGRATSQGASLNSTTLQLNVFKSISPGEAQTSDVGEIDLPNQILTVSATDVDAETELITRSANFFAQQNGKVTLTVAHPDGWNWLTPSVAHWYTFTLDAEETPTGRAYTTDDRWFLSSVSFNYSNEKGTCDIQAVYELETAGSGGIAFKPQVPADTYPDFQFNPGDPYYNFPNDPDVGSGDDTVVDDGGGFPGTNPTPIPTDGSLVIFCEADRVWRATSFKSDSPVYADITPDSTAYVACVQFDQTRTDRKLGIYVLGNDGSSTYVDYAPNVLANPVDYTRGESIEGVYTDLRVGSTPGTIEVYSPLVSVTIPDPDCTPAFYDLTGSSVAPVTIATGSLVVGQDVTLAWDGYEWMASIQITCTALLSPTSQIQVKWYQSDFATLYGGTLRWLNSSGTILRTQGVSAGGPGERTWTSTTVVSTADRVQFYTFAPTTHPTRYIRSIEIL